MRFTEFKLPDDLEIAAFTDKRIPLCTAGSLKPVRFQIPRMYMPFGLSGFTPQVGATKWNIDFSMKGWDEEGNYVKRFYDFVKTLEGLVIDKVVSNSEEIFGVFMDREEVAKLFNSNIKETTDRDPKFRLKVDTTSEGVIKPDVFDMNEVNVTGPTENQLYARHSGVAMVELSSVYFLNRQFGLVWKLQQLKTFEPQRLKGFHFIGV